MKKRRQSRGDLLRRRTQSGMPDGKNCIKGTAGERRFTKTDSYQSRLNPITEETKERLIRLLDGERRREAIRWCVVFIAQVLGS